MELTEDMLQDVPENRRCTDRNSTRFIEVLEIQDGYNGHKCALAVVWDYADRQLLFVHAAGFYCGNQSYLDHCRKN